MARLPFLWRDYYDGLSELARNVEAAAQALRTLTTRWQDVSATARLVKEIEHKGDAITRDLLTRMERAALTSPPGPLRDIARALDDVLDAIEAASDAFDLYGVEQPTGAATELIELAVRCAEQIPPAVSVLSESPRRGARLAALRPLREEINRLENLSDKVHREASGALFRQSDVALMLKWKAIYDSLEQISDRCDDVGDALQAAALRDA